MSRWLFTTLLFSGSLLAQEDKLSIEDMAMILYGGVDWVTQLIHVLCVVLGIALIVMGFSFFKMHRDNPKYVPLDKPIAYLFLGLVLMSIPLWSALFGSSGSSIDLEKKEQEQLKAKLHDIDAPVKTTAKPKRKLIQKETVIYDVDEPLTWQEE